MSSSVPVPRFGRDEFLKNIHPFATEMIAQILSDIHSNNFYTTRVIVGTRVIQVRSISIQLPCPESFKEAVHLAGGVYLPGSVKEASFGDVAPQTPELLELVDH